MAVPKHVDYRITIEGILFVLCALAIGFGAYNTGNALLYLILSTMLAFLIVSGVVAIGIVSMLDVKRLLPSAIHARHLATLQIQLHNRKRWLDSYSLRIDDEVMPGAEVSGGYILHLPARAQRRVAYHVVFPRRGRHRLGNIYLRSRFPFGFFERSARAVLDDEVLVLPRIHKLSSMPQGALHRLGEQPSGQRGEGIELLALREHVASDPARQIHWKASARSGRLIVRETERDAEQRFDLILDNAPGSSGDPQAIAYAFEQAIEFTASLGCRLLRFSKPFRLVTRSGILTLQGVPSEQMRFLRTLAMLQLDLESSAQPFAAGVGGRDAVQIGYAPGERRHAARYIPRQEWLPWLTGAPVEEVAHEAAPAGGQPVSAAVA